MFLLLAALTATVDGLPLEFLNLRSFNKRSLTTSLQSNSPSNSHSNPSAITVSSQGWTSSPNSRGTIDIIWSCFVTVFLCGWTATCTNVRPLGSTRRGNFWRKLLVFFETLAGPEFVVHTAIGEYIVARQSVRDFKEVGVEGWTIKHGFFANMGGFVLDLPDFVPFPLTVGQLHYLVKYGYVDYSDILLTKEEIEDKNKFDTLTRIITVMQLCWFLISVLARVVLGLALTTLELSTIGFVFCSFFTFVFWRHKPQDVSCPILLRPQVSLAKILVEAGPVAAEPYSYTPMDFASHKAHMFHGIWRHCFRLPEAFGFYFHPRERPIVKIWDDNFPVLTPWGNAVLAFIQVGFAAIHVAAWNSHFPTDIERTMWHVCTVYIICSMGFVWAILSCAYEVQPRLVRRLEEQQAFDPSFLSRLHSRWRASRLCYLLKRLEKHIGNNSSNKAPQETVPLFVVVTLVPVAIVYALARAAIILEDMINLRNLPTSVYVSIDWSAFLPHF